MSKAKGRFRVEKEPIRSRGLLEDYVWIVFFTKGLRTYALWVTRTRREARIIRDLFKALPEPERGYGQVLMVLATAGKSLKELFAREKATIETLNIRADESALPCDICGNMPTILYHSNLGKFCVSCRDKMDKK
jgi:hypothetical protein